MRWRAILVTFLLGVGFFKADQLTTLAEENELGGKIIYTAHSPYQRIAITQKSLGFQLFLNGHLQFNSVDEYRYHGALVHPAMLGNEAPKQVLVMGGGDGLAIRECLKYSSVESLSLVDLDPAMTQLSQKFEPLNRLNKGAYSDPRVRVINEDAFLWIGKPGPQYDAVIIDLPDPGTYSVGKLYTTRFFRLLQKRLKPAALVSVQCTSPLVAPKSFWCIIRTLEEAGFHVRPYHAAVPSFGIWGFALASMSEFDSKPLPFDRVGGELRFLTNDVLQGLFELPADLQPMDTEVNRLDNQALVHYYDSEWNRSD